MVLEIPTKSYNKETKNPTKKDNEYIYTFTHQIKLPLHPGP